MSEKEDWEAVLEDMFKRMAKARDEARGMRLTYKEIQCLELTYIGELMDEYDRTPKPKQ